MAKKAGTARPKQNTASTSKAAVKKTPTAAKKAVRVNTKPRRLRPPTYKSLRLHKRIRHQVTLPNAWRLTRMAAHTLWTNRRLFVGITLVYGLLNLVLVQGIAGGTDVSGLKASFDQIFHGHFGSLFSSLGIFATLLSSAGNSSSQTAGAYQVILGIIASLAVIWALRQALTGVKLRIRDPYYRGMYPLIPFILVLIVISLQLIPMLVGSTLYALVINNGIAVYTIEKVLWGLFYGLLTLLSLYLVSSSLFALYVVTLPDMTPMKALRTARELVRYRRWTVLRKLLWLPVVLLIVAAIVMLPIILWLTPAAQWVFFLLTMGGLVAFHAYVYTLYRELLNE